MSEALFNLVLPVALGPHQPVGSPDDPSAPSLPYGTGTLIKGGHYFRQFVTRFKCGCCVRWEAVDNHYDIELAKWSCSKCDMANGCFYDEELLQVAVDNRNAPSERTDVEWGWEGQPQAMASSDRDKVESVKVESSSKAGKSVV